MDVICPTYLAKAAAQTCIFSFAHRNLLYHVLSLFWDFLAPTGSKELRCASPYLSLSWKNLHGPMGTDMLMGYLGPWSVCGQGGTMPWCIYTQWAPARAPPETFSWPAPNRSSPQLAGIPAVMCPFPCPQFSFGSNGCSSGCGVWLSCLCPLDPCLSFQPSHCSLIVFLELLSSWAIYQLRMANSCG